MARPRNEHPTPAELEVLRVLWEGGGKTVREVMEKLAERDPSEGRAYTSVMSLMNVMTEKGLLARKPKGKAFVYSAKANRERTLGEMVSDLLERAFAGSASALVTHLIGKTTPDELAEIRRTIEEHQKGGRP